MGTRVTTELGDFGRAVRSEILAELGRAQITAFGLSKIIDRSANYLNKRITNAEMELSLSDIEMICEALNIPIAPLMERAEFMMYVNDGSWSFDEAVMAAPEHLRKELYQRKAFYDFKEAPEASELEQSRYALAANHERKQEEDAQEVDYF